MATVLRLLVALLVLAAVTVGGAAPAAGDPPARVSSYYLGRGDPRACPSPICGGVWIRLLNKTVTPCAGAVPARRECYVATLDLSALGLSEEGSLAGLVANGRAAARGTIVTGRVEGFPELATLLVSEIWTASSSLRAPEGRFRLLRDNRRRCITSPCYSTHAALLNSSGHADVSEVRLTTGTPQEKLCGLSRLSADYEGLIAAGRIVRVPHAGPAGVGRRLVATQYYVRKSPPTRPRCP
jgi:hypothetical protein